MPEPRKKKGWSADAKLIGGTENPEKDLPPWERENPAYGVGAGKDEKSSHNVSARLTAREARDLQRIVQHRKYPVVENTSDCIRVGLVMFRYWYAIHKDDPQMKEQIDIEMWEAERLARSRYRDRVLKVLEGMEVEMAEARRLGYENRLKVLCAELSKYKEKLSDEELRGKASRIYVEFMQKSKEAG